MGNYLNPGGEAFQKMINFEIYVDKTGLLNYTNRVLNTMQEFLSQSKNIGQMIALIQKSVLWESIMI